MKKNLILLSLILIILIACNDNEVIVNNAIVQGYTIDFNTGETIKNVAITATSLKDTVFSDANGFFVLKNVSSGQITLKFDKESFSEYSLNLRVENGKSFKINALMEHKKKDKLLSKTLPSALVPYLVAYYPFDGDCNDYSGNNHSGVNYNATFCMNKDSNQNSALRLDYSKKANVTMGDIDAFNLSGFSYCFWVRRRANIGLAYDDHIDIVSRWGVWGIENEALTYCIGRKGNLKFIYYNHAYNSDPSSWNNYTFIDTKYYLEPEEWTHVVFTSSDNITKLFINGNLYGTFTTILPQSSSYYGLKVGSRFDDYYRTNFNGDVDELFVFSKALALDEVRMIYGL